MKIKSYQVAFPMIPVLVMAALLTAVFFADSNPSFAASGSKKSTADVRTSAVAYTEARIKELKNALKITEAQKDLWSNLTQVMLENARDMDALTKGVSEKTKTMNAVENMKFRSQIAEAHLVQLKKFIPPFEALYNSMSDAQKKNADTIFLTGKDGKNIIK